METKFIVMTPEELERLAERLMQGKASASTCNTQQTEKRLVYGLRGIRELFNVSHVTAQRYKSTFLQPAVMQRGRKIIVDADLAMRLYNEHQSA